MITSRIRIIDIKNETIKFLSKNFELYFCNYKDVQSHFQPHLTFKSSNFEDPSELRNTSLGATSSSNTGSCNKSPFGGTHVTSENKILESPQWNNKVDFTLKESVLHDIDKSQTEAIENRITKAENKIIFALVGCTVSIITSFISLNSTSNKKETDKKIVYVKIRD
ncbi:8125_t:CDS:2 [Funneliformis mosseae]|uniref:8125_t:CDS:1 n=1 Tax=Funneliformis mosseae TaxID=27381 RepID=A0A9N9DJ79_FUNMO|nr:8125_t:CDS:2 [Funneliformis mosseae]